MAKRPKATTAETADRVDEICRMMTCGEWIRGKSEDVLAESWGLSASRVRELSAEAWRRVCHESDRPEQARPNIVGMLQMSMSKAYEAGKYSDVAKIADVWTRIIGAREPERREDVVLTEEQAREKYRELTGKDWGT